MIELLKEWSDFEKKQAAKQQVPEIRDFCLAYLAEFFTKKASEKYFNYAEVDLDEHIVLLLHRLNKIAHLMLKKAIEPELDNIEDLMFLKSMIGFRDQRKSFLIEHNWVDAPTGFDVIERLEKNNLSDSIPDSKDKRAKLNRLTPKGRQAISKTKAKVETATHLVTGNLAEAQKFILLKLLDQMAEYHDQKYSLKLRDQSLKGIKDFYDKDSKD